MSFKYFHPTLRFLSKDLETRKIPPNESDGGVETRHDTSLFANLEQATTFHGIFASRGEISGRNVSFHELERFLV